MRKVIKVAAVISGLSLSLMSSSAMAGDCRYGPSGPNCAPGVVTHPGAAPSIDPSHTYSQRPMGHLRTVQFLGTPSVNITRVHGLHGGPGLTDAPSAFTGGCTPESTQYCRNGASVPSPAPAPYIAQPAPMMVAPAPVIAAPVPQVTERVVAIGGGYDPSKFIPRTYGSNELTPGIAHIPTSIVDRSHENATAVLNGGMARPQAIASGGTVPHPSMISGGNVMADSITMPPTMSRSITMPPTMSRSISMPPTMSPNVVGMVSNTVTLPPQTNVYAGSMAGDGTYYEKVSGPTMLGGMQATQIICKRQAPRVQVQSPVIGVPTPVPTPVATCQAVPAPMTHIAPQYAPQPAPQPAPMRSTRFGSSRYGH